MSKLFAAMRLRISRKWKKRMKKSDLDVNKWVVQKCLNFNFLFKKEAMKSLRLASDDPGTAFMNSLKSFTHRTEGDLWYDEFFPVIEPRRLLRSVHLYKLSSSRTDKLIELLGSSRTLMNVLLYDIKYEKAKCHSLWSMQPKHCSRVAPNQKKGYDIAQNALNQDSALLLFCLHRL